MIQFKNERHELVKEKAVHGGIEMGLLDHFLGKQDKFELYGTGEPFRGDAEMKHIDTDAAEKALKLCVKELMTPAMKSFGFVKWKPASYVRVNRIGLLEYIDVQKEHYGSRTFTVNVAIMPLYAPESNMCIGFGERVGQYVNGKEFWWDYKDEVTAGKSFENVIEAIQRFVLPWFEKVCEGEYYLDCLKSAGYCKGFPEYEWAAYYYVKHRTVEDAKQFLRTYRVQCGTAENEKVREYQFHHIDRVLGVMDSIQNPETFLREIIAKNFEVLKLPKSIEMDTI